MDNLKKFKEKKQRVPRIILVIVGFLFFTLAGGFWGFILASDFYNKLYCYDEPKEVGGKVIKGDIPEYLAKDVDFKLMWEVWDVIEKNYIDRPISKTQLFYGALAGSVDSLNDPYSVFLEPKNATEFNEELASTFSGIGAEIGIKKEFLTIIAPLPDSPAQKAGIRSGDIVYKIDGEESLGISTDKAVDLIRGEKGTEVILTIIREGESEPFDISIIRDEIHFKTVEWENREDGIFYIKVSHFNNDTDALFNEAVREIEKVKPKGIALDLRGNPGGFLDVAVNIAGHWVKKGDLVVKEKFNDTQELPYNSSGNAELSNIPTAILVNFGSASASEIVSGALQDYGFAKLIGAQTFGKGSVQTLEDLSDGSAIKITIAKWHTPKGRIIEGEGITPDIKVEFTDDDYNNDRDPQLDKAVEVLSK